MVTPSKKRFYRQLHSILCNCRLLNTVRQPFFYFLSYLQKQTWPDPIQKIWLSLNIEEAVQERTNDIEWVPITDIPIEMQQALLAIEDHNFYNHGAIDVDGILRATLVQILLPEK